MDDNEMRRAYPLRRKLGAALAGIALMLFGATAHAAASGVHVTPRLTSVEGGTSQLFSVKFFDAAGGPAAGEIVTFSNDACGTFPGGGFFEDVVSDPSGVATILFTADSLGGVVCDVTATAGVPVRFEVVTYTQSQIEIIPATPSTRPAPGQPYLLSAAVRMGQQTLYNLEVTARVIPDQAVSAFFVPPTLAITSNSGQNGTVAFTVQPDTNVGTYDLELRVGEYTRTLTIYFNADFNHQGLWWVGESENGWGVTIVQHGDKLFVVIFTYDLQGNPLWYTMPAGAWTTGGAGFTGVLYLSRGSPFHAYNAAAFDPRPVGFATLNLTSTGSISIEYTIDDVSDVKQLTQFPFAEGPPSDPRFDDMWWGGESQNGQGVAILQREQALFLLWFTYRDNGTATWYSMPSGTWTSATTYEGRIYRTVGWPWLGRVYLPERLEVIDVGSYRFRTLPNGTAALDYTIDGRTGTFALSRFPF